MFAAPKLIWSWKTTGSVGKGRTEGEAKDREVLVALWSGEGRDSSQQLPPSSTTLLLCLSTYPSYLLGKPEPAHVSVPWATRPGCI